MTEKRSSRPLFLTFFSPFILVTDMMEPLDFFLKKGLEASLSNQCFIMRDKARISVSFLIMTIGKLFIVFVMVAFGLCQSFHLVTSGLDNISNFLFRVPGFFYRSALFMRRMNCCPRDIEKERKQVGNILCNTQKM